MGLIATSRGDYGDAFAFTKGARDRLHAAHRHAQYLRGSERLVAQTCQAAPLSGHLLVLFNRRRDRIKILAWDCDGLRL